MRNVRNPYWIALLVALMVAWGSEAMAQTGVHGFNIPTAETERGPAIAVCGPTDRVIEGGQRSRLGNRGMTGIDSRRFSASVCLPGPTDTGPRGFRVPEEVAEAIVQIEHRLVAHFEHDSAEFTDEVALPALDVIVAWLQATPNAGLKLKGHTDSTGSAEYNLDLAQRRTEAVKALFVERGIAPERIRNEWYGENNLLLALAGRQRDNRRVEIEVYQIVDGETGEPFVPPVPVNFVPPTAEVPDTPAASLAAEDTAYEPLPFPLPEDE